MGKFKEIKSLTELDDNDPDAAFFTIGYNEEMTEIILTLKTNVKITPEEYFSTLNEFLNVISENPDSLFVEEPNEDNPGLH